jgi:glutathione peroxidase
MLDPESDHRRSVARESLTATLKGWMTIGTSFPGDALYDIELITIDGASITMEAYRGQTVLVVNVASRCGYTPQYAGLENLYRRYGDRGFVVLGFPCNQFGHQEPADERTIHEFCLSHYDVSFPMFAKIDVNGPNAHPLYRYLKASKRGLLGWRAIPWNFSKFLINKNGEVIRRYGAWSAPEQIDADIMKILGGAEK